MGKLPRKFGNYMNIHIFMREKPSTICKLKQRLSPLFWRLDRLTGKLNKAVALPQAVAQPFIEGTVHALAPIETGTNLIVGKKRMMLQVSGHHFGLGGVVVDPNAQIRQSH